MLLNVLSPQLNIYLSAGWDSKKTLKQVSVSAEGVASALAVHRIGVVKRREATATICLVDFGSRAECGCARNHHVHLVNNQR